MTGLPLAAAAAATGFLGSLHCVGMCGPLALALGGAGGSGVSLRLLRFVAGKSVTYVVLGLLAGLIGSGLGGQGAGTDFQSMIALVAGVVMVALGIENRGGDAQSSPSAVGSLLVRLLRDGQGRAPLVGGMLVGLLPCGLVYAMVAQALATGSILEGGLVMTGFALGTAPAMLLSGWLGSRLSAAARQTGERLASGAVVVMGLVAIYRGATALWFATPAGLHCH